MATNLTQQNYPIPPPPPPPPPTLSETSTKKGFHGPKTNFFPSVRTNLTRLETARQGVSNAILKKGLIIALILAATLSFALSFVTQIATGIPGTDAALLVLVAPITEEIFKGLSILIVAFFIWKTIPSRRYGALLGAAAGLGFSIAENVLFTISYTLLGGQVINGQAISGGLIAELIAERWISIPFMHVVWSALVGMGIFVLLSRGKNVRSTPFFLVALFPLLGLCNHILWNLIALASSGLSPFVILIIDVLLIFVPFSILFRDFLGGHFNFQDFLHPVQETMNYPQISSYPPPPPPPP